MSWTQQQAKQAARLFFGPRAIGTTCRIENLMAGTVPPGEDDSAPF